MTTSSEVHRKAAQAAWSVIDAGLQKRGLRTDRAKANALGISVKTYSRYLEGENQPLAITMFTYCSIAGVNVEDVESAARAELAALS